LPLTSGALRRRLRLRKGLVGRRSERASSFGKLRWLGRSRRLFPNVLQISEGTNSVGIVRLDLGFCLCAVSGCGGLIK